MRPRSPWPLVRALLAILASAGLIAVSAPAPVLAQSPGARTQPGAGTTAAAAPSAAGIIVGGIAAVVNDEPVTRAELLGRETLTLIAANLPDTPENRQRLRPQVLRSLIDEALQLQEARRNNITINAADIERGVATIARQNRLTPEQLRAMLGRNGIPVSIVESQVRSSLSWQRLAQRRLGATVSIGEDDIDDVIRRIESNLGKQEYLASEIFLPVDRPDQEESVRDALTRLREQIAGGADFQLVAQQFSQGAGAAVGGDIGWVQEGQLPEELDQSLRTLRPGTLSQPIRSVSGWHLLQLRQRRTVSLTDPDAVEIAFRQIIVPNPSSLDPFAILDQARAADTLRTSLTACDTADRNARAVGATIGDVIRRRVGDLPGELGQVLRTLEPGGTTNPLRSREGLNIFLVCEKIDNSGERLSRDRIRSVLLNERLDLLQRRLLRDLRRNAFIDIRV